MKRKAQIQMLETMAVLLIFFILIVLGIVFYTNILKGNIGIQKEEVMQLNAIEISQRASSLPELQCSEENIVSENCIDLLKLQSASEIIPLNEVFYYDSLLFSKINITEVYPDNSRSWVLYNHTLEEFSNKIVTNIPISLFDPVTNKNSFGVMSVELFSR